MAFEIIPQDLYLSIGQDNYLNPSWFNSVFNNINAHSMNNNLFTRPINVIADTQAIIWKEDDTGTFSSIAPELIKLKEVGSDLMPAGWSVSYLWIFPEDPLFVPVDGYAGTEKEMELEVSTQYDLNSDHSILESLAAFTVQLQVTYTDLNGIETITSAAYSLPIVQLLDGTPAITSPKALIWIDSQHKPRSEPNGKAVFNVEDISYYPPSSTNAESSPWSLSIGGVPKNNYITDAGDGTATISIPEVGKTFDLTLTVTVGGDTQTKTIQISTYEYGSFLFSSWGQETPVEGPRKVFLSGTNKTAKDNNQLFPSNSASLTVKWGKNVGDISRKNIGDKTGDIFCISGLSEDSTYKSAVRDVMTEYGLGVNENVENYSLIQVNEEDVNQDGVVNVLDYVAGGSLIGQKFWAENMSENAEILFKSTNSTITVTGNPLISGNALFLVKGIVPSGVQSKIAISSGAERYYIRLKSYSIDPTSGTYSRSYQYDQYNVVAQSEKAAPVETTFNGIPLDTIFKASVVSAKGSAYSREVQSEGYYSLSSAGVASQVITAIDVSSSQYGVSLDISTDMSKDQPAGYLINYVEMNANSTWPSSIDVPISGASGGIVSIYTTTQTAHLTATIGQRVVASVRAVMADGSIGNAVTTEPSTVNVPWSYLESGLSKGLGRFSYTVQEHDIAGGLLEHLSIVSPNTQQTNLFTTAFGRDVFIETLVVWVYESSLSGSGPYEIKLQADSMSDANDEKVVEIAKITEVDSNNSLLTSGEIPVGTIRKYIIPDLSIPITAGTDVVIALQGHSIGDTIDVEAELHYSNGNIVTSTTPGPDSGTQPGSGGGGPA